MLTNYLTTVSLTRVGAATAAAHEDAAQLARDLGVPLDEALSEAALERLVDKFVNMFYLDFPDLLRPEESMEECRRDLPGAELFYIGTGMTERVTKALGDQVLAGECFAFAGRRYKLFELKDDTAVFPTAGTLWKNGWKVIYYDSLYITNLASNMNRLEKAVQVRLRNQTGSLWLRSGAGGNRQPADGAGQQFSLFVTHGPCPEGCTATKKAQGYWE